MHFKKDDARIIRGWAMFDWANSAYNLVITSTIFPVYYTVITSTREHGDKVTFFGKTFVNTALANYSLSVAYLLMAILLPLFSSIADYRGKKKAFMKAFTWLGSLACAMLFFFKADKLELGIICSSLAAMGYIGGVMFSNSYLPVIASQPNQDRVSAQGFAYGYIGSVLLQIICFVFVLKPEWFNITDASLPPRISFLLTGIWWITFSQFAFRVLPESKGLSSMSSYANIKSGYQELVRVFRRIQAMKEVKRFLVAFFFYSVGVQTIMLVAAGFGEKVLHLGTSKLIAVILIIQVVAIFGAYLMSAMARRIGNISVLIITVIIWMGVCLSAWKLSSELQFYMLAVVVGIVMGGIQSLSRSTYSKYIPETANDTASFFSFYDVTEKLAIVCGLASFAFIEERSNIRNSALALTVFFVIAVILLFVLLRTKKTQE